jgi:hypothetical protein
MRSRLDWITWLVSREAAPTVAEAVKMASTSVNCIVREADECKVLGWVCWEDLSGRGPQTFYTTVA